MELRRWLLLLFLLPTLALAAGSKRTAMVVETRGKNLVTIGSESARMRTLQVLPEGASVTVPQGAVLRLTYFSSGKKEKVIGPCEFLVSNGASHKTGGEGKIEVQSRRDASTELEKTENLRRMGGALQANATEEPKDLLIKLERSRLASSHRPSRTTYSSTASTGSTESEASVVVTSQMPRPISTAPADESGGGAASPGGSGDRTRGKPKHYSSTVKFKTPRFSDFSPVYPDLESASLIQWRGGPSKAQAKVARGGEILSINQGTRHQVSISTQDLQPETEYTIVLQGKGLNLSGRFSVMSEEKRAAYLRKREELTDQGRYDHRTMYAQLILLQNDLGLYREAKTTALLALQEFPNDPGFLQALAQLEYWMGDFVEAKRLLQEAAAAEEVQYQ